MAVYSDLVPLLKVTMQHLSDACKNIESALLSNAPSSDVNEQTSMLAHASMALLECMEKYCDKPELLIDSVATARKWYSNLYRAFLPRADEADLADLKDAIEQMGKALKKAQENMEAVATDRERQLRGVFTHQADELIAPCLRMQDAIANAKSADLANVLRQSADEIPRLFMNIVQTFSTTAGTKKHQVWTISAFEKVEAELSRVKRVALQRFDSIMQSKERTDDDYSALAVLLRLVEKVAVELLLIQISLAKILAGQ